MQCATRLYQSPNAPRGAPRLRVVLSSRVQPRKLPLPLQKNARPVTPHRLPSLRLYSASPVRHGTVENGSFRWLWEFSCCARLLPFRAVAEVTTPFLLSKRSPLIGLPSYLGCCRHVPAYSRSGIRLSGFHLRSAASWWRQHAGHAGLSWATSVTGGSIDHQRAELQARIFQCHAQTLRPQKLAYSLGTARDTEFCIRTQSSGSAK